MLITKLCKECLKEYVSENWRKRIFCSKSCAMTSLQRSSIGRPKKQSTIDKIRKSMVGKYAGVKNYFYGMKSKPIEWERKRISSLPRGTKHHAFGKPQLEEVKEKISNTLMGRNSGSASPFWKGGISPINKKVRNSRKYKLWRTAVFERDSFTCQICGETNCYVEADHIKPFSIYPALRFIIDNGRTLCLKCHKDTETWGFKMKTYKLNYQMIGG